MKKILLLLLLLSSFCNSKAQLVYITGDTLQWLKTNIEDRSISHFSGKSFKTVLDSLYQLKSQIVEFDPPLNIGASCGGTKAGAITTVDSLNPNLLYVNKLTMYFGAISDGGTVWQIHRNLSDSNYEYNQNNTVNTHVKFFTVIFQQTVPYPRYIADSKNGTWLWSAFAEYFWGPNIIQSVSVGEY